MSTYPGGNYNRYSSFRTHVPVTTDYLSNYGNTTSTSNAMSTRLTATGASGYDGHSARTGEYGTGSTLATKLGELDIHNSQGNSKLPITDPSRNLSSSIYPPSNHGHDKLVNDMFSSKNSPVSSSLPSNLRQEERDKPDPVDPRSSLRKLLDCVKELQDLDVEKCLNDYKKIKEASDPMALTKEVFLQVVTVYSEEVSIFLTCWHLHHPWKGSEVQCTLADFSLCGFGDTRLFFSYE